jgi:uncharacterized membrane protein YsdA (DUF1294 family)
LYNSFYICRENYTNYILSVGGVVVCIKKDTFVVFFIHVGVEACWYTVDMGNNIWLALVAALVLVNVVAFGLVGRDKGRSVAHGERFPEVYFFFLAVFFASPGVFAGLFAFRHKTQKLYFPLGIGLLLVEQIVLVYCLWRLFAGV